MNKTEKVIAFEAALKGDKELREKFLAAQKSIAENNELDPVDILLKATAEVGYPLTAAEVECMMAQTEEISDEELAKVAGGSWSFDDDSIFLPYTCVSVISGNTAGNNN